MLKTNCNGDKDVGDEFGRFVTNILYCLSSELDIKIYHQHSIPSPILLSPTSLWLDYQSLNAKYAITYYFNTTEFELGLVG